MGNISISVPDDLKQKIANLEEVNWSAVARVAFEEKINQIEFLRKIISKSKLTEKDVNDFIDLLKNRIKIVPEEFFIGYREKAGNICPHEKDITYFALALFLKCPIWSNEKKLKEQDYIKIYTTKELIGLFGI